jgi:hypothetical protein
VRAHGGPSAADDYEVRLDPLAPELAGVRVQVQRTAANQLVVENATGRALEVLDERGVPFVRIGPSGVEGNTAAPAWYRGFAPEGGPVPREALERARAGGEPRWVVARREPSWGWFDARIAATAHDAKRWEIPVRIGGVATALRGTFVARPAPRGLVRARLVSDPQLAPGVRISLVPGEVATFFLESDAAEPVTVFGRDGEPFLRVAPSGVEANLHSATFADAAALRGGADLALEPRADTEPRWQSISPQPRYAWIDTRTAVPGGAAPDAVVKKGARAELVRWSVPVRIGAAADAPLVRVEGVTEWTPLPAMKRGAAR